MKPVRRLKLSASEFGMARGVLPVSDLKIYQSIQGECVIVDSDCSLGKEEGFSGGRPFFAGMVEGDAVSVVEATSSALLS